MEDNNKEIIEVEKVETVQETDKKENTENTKKEETEFKRVEEPKKEKKGFCITSMVLGIIALIFFCIWYISIPCGILAIIFGILGLKGINKGMAIAGLITGGIGLVVSSLIIMAIFTLGVVVGITDALDEIDYEEYDTYNSYEDYEWDYDYE